MTHNFNSILAERYGIEAAILIELIYSWVHKNDCEEVEDMNHNGKYWCRSTAKGFAKYIPYMKPDKIWRTLKKLEGKVLITGNFNRQSLNQTLWYTFTDEFEKELKELNYDFEKFKNANLKNKKSYNSNINIPIKDNNIHDNKKRLSNDNQKEEIIFEDFYKIYPLKKSRRDAEKAWGKLSLKEKKEAIKRLPAYIADCLSHNRSYQYPARYLNAGTWNDQFDDDETGEMKEDDTPTLLPPGMTQEQWEKVSAWMVVYIKHIAGKITPIMLAQMKKDVNGDSSLLSDILVDLDERLMDLCNYDVYKEFKKLLKEDEYQQQL